MRYVRLLRPARRLAGWLVLAALAVAGWLIPASDDGVGVEPPSVTADLGHNPVQLWP